MGYLYHAFITFTYLGHLYPACVMLYIYLVGSFIPYVGQVYLLGLFIPSLYYALQLGLLIPFYISRCGVIFRPSNP